MEPLSDFELMERIRRDDAEAFEELFRRYQTVLHGFFRRLGANHEADDLVQETFIRIFCHRARYSPDAKFTTFLFTVARNIWTDRWRKHERGARCKARIEEEMLSGHTVLSSVLATRLDAETALHALPPKLREVLVLSVYQGLTHPEISVVLGIPVGTVKSRMFLALQKLREYFDEQKP